MATDEERIQAEKSTYRELAKARLKSVSEAAEVAAGEAIAQTVEALEAFAQAKLVLAFLSMPGEIDTNPVIESALAKGKRVAVPRIEAADIVFVELEAGWKSWPHDRYKIPTPPSSLAALSLLDMLAQPCLALTPGLAFDAKRMRLGRGKGYYDRFLARIDEAMRGVPGAVFSTCGIGFSCQRFEKLPSSPHDRRLDALILV